MSSKKIPDTSVIPFGIYCYTAKGIKMGKTASDFKIETDICPYWTKNKQGVSCKYLEAIGATLEISLLWNQCKECGINEAIE